MDSILTIVFIITALSEMAVVAEYIDPIHNVTVEKTLQGVETISTQQTKILNDRFTEQAKQTGALETRLEALERSLASVAQQNRQILSAISDSSRSQLELLQPLQSLISVTFLHRKDGSVNFYRYWADYKGGFGDRDGEFWLGLDSLHRLTSQYSYKFRVDLTDWSGSHKWAEYATFRVASEEDKFKLTVTGYNSASTAGDSMAAHNGMFFSTRDRDNDIWHQSCAINYTAGWWYSACRYANPTGVYRPAGYHGWNGVWWYHAYNDDRSFKEVILTMIKVESQVTQVK